MPKPSASIRQPKKGNVLERYFTIETKRFFETFFFNIGFPRRFLWNISLVNTNNTVDSVNVIFNQRKNLDLLSVNQSYALRGKINAE